MKTTINTFIEKKINNEKIAMLTSYDYCFASIADSVGIDGILVGDSLGMVKLGYADTLSVTIDDIVYHSRAVNRAVRNALVISDMPFMSYHTSVYDSIKNAGRLIQDGASKAVKLEGGISIVPKIKGIIRAQIPVMGHIGLTPQSVNLMGGYKVQGKTLEDARSIIESAKMLEDAGVFAIVLECIPYKLAKKITESISIPTIGIGAGAYCDGQILVIDDMLNLHIEQKKKFVEIFADAGNLIKSGINDYISKVRDNEFPSVENSFSISDDIIDKIY